MTVSMHIYLRNVLNTLACQLYIMTKEVTLKPNNVKLLSHSILYWSLNIRCRRFIDIIEFKKTLEYCMQDVSRVFEIEYSTYHILNRLELCDVHLWLVTIC